MKKPPEEPLRISRTLWLSEIIKVTAKRSTCPRLHVGAALVLKNQILGLSYNGAPPGLPHCEEIGCQIQSGHCIRATHAEINLLLGCARSGTSTEDTELWVTQAPCSACSKAIIRAGVKRVYFLEHYRTTNGLCLMRQAGLGVFYIAQDGRINLFSSLCK